MREGCQQAAVTAMRSPTSSRPWWSCRRRVRESCPQPLVPPLSCADLKEGKREHGQCGVPVPGVVAADLVVVQAGLVLGGLEAFLDRPPCARRSARIAHRIPSATPQGLTWAARPPPDLRVPSHLDDLRGGRTLVTPPRRTKISGWEGRGLARFPLNADPFPVPARQTVHAVLPHTAYRRSSPAVFGLPAPVPEGPGRDDGSMEAGQAQVIRG